MKPSPEAIEAAQTAYHDYRIERSGNTSVEDVLGAALDAAYAVDMPNVERILELVAEWERTRDGVLSPGLRKAVDDMQGVGLAIKADNDAVRRDSFQRHINRPAADVSGFIDPEEPTKRRLDRLELLIEEALEHVGIEALSPEAQALLLDLDSENPHRRALAQRDLAERFKRDPLPPDSGSTPAAGDKKEGDT